MPRPCPKINSVVKSRERRARLTLKDIGQRKRRAAIASSSYAVRGGNGAGATPGGNGYGYGGSAAAARAVGSPSQRGGLFFRVIRALTAVVPGFSSTSSGNTASFSSAAQAAAEVSLVDTQTVLARSWLGGRIHVFLRLSVHHANFVAARSLLSVVLSQLSPLSRTGATDFLFVSETQCWFVPGL